MAAPQPGPDPAMTVSGSVQKYVTKKKKVLTVEEAELFELVQAAGIVMDQEVFKIIVDLLKMNVAPLAVYQMLKSMCAGHRPIDTATEAHSSPGLAAHSDTRGRTCGLLSTEMRLVSYEADSTGGEQRSRAQRWRTDSGSYPMFTLVTGIVGRWRAVCVTALQRPNSDAAAIRIVSAVSRHLNGKSVGRKQCGRKRCTTRRGDRTLRKIVEKDRFQTLGNLRKQWTESGVETSRATVHRRVQEMGYRCRIPQGRVNAASYQEILEHFMLPSAEMLYGDEDFIFQHDLAPAHSAKTTVKWFTDHGITVLNWPANSPDLNPIENLWDIVKRKLRDARPNTLDELKAAIEASWASITSQQCHRLIASMPRRIEAVISAKGFPTKY
ncbi:unnamed protein product [Ranitomeya imitator]|uniref:Tc1-like transposase DDE domain-containing protein n=1 Tax=Ranitomeya imitator TaxID=111125 RepID=A0ABN9KR04_9NEOB|nr:unnamed protein product [Ranitomeya imitator]